MAIRDHQHDATCDFTGDAVQARISEILSDSFTSSSFKLLALMDEAVGIVTHRIEKPVTLPPALPQNPDLFTAYETEKAQTAYQEQLTAHEQQQKAFLHCTTSFSTLLVRDIQDERKKFDPGLAFEYTRGDHEKYTTSVNAYAYELSLRYPELSKFYNVTAAAFAHYCNKEYEYEQTALEYEQAQRDEEREQQKRLDSEIAAILKPENEKKKKNKTIITPQAYQSLYNTTAYALYTQNSLRANPTVHFMHMMYHASDAMDRTPNCNLEKIEDNRELLVAMIYTSRHQMLHPFTKTPINLSEEVTYENPDTKEIHTGKLEDHAARIGKKHPPLGETFTKRINGFPVSVACAHKAAAEKYGENNPSHARPASPNPYSRSPGWNGLISS